MRFQHILLLVLIVILFSCSSGGGGSGSGGGGTNTNTLSFSGHVMVPSTASLLGGGDVSILDIFDTTPVGNAHVNLCYYNSSGNLVKIPGTSTIIADASGAFTLSVNPNTVPADRRIALCASKSNGAYQLYSIIPSDLLPTNLGDITTVSVDVSAETSVVTRFLCSQPMLSLSASKGCQIVDSDRLALMTAFDSQGQSPNSLSSGFSGQWGTFFTNGQAFFNAIKTWGATQGFAADGSWIANTVTNTATYPSVSGLISTTDPTGAWSGSWTVSTPAQCAGLSGSWTATFSVTNGVLGGSWNAGAAAGGVGGVSGSNSGGAITFGITGGGGGISFSGAIGGTGAAIAGSFTGRQCTDGVTNYGIASGSFSGTRN